MGREAWGGGYGEEAHAEAWARGAARAEPRWFVLPSGPPPSGRCQAARWVGSSPRAGPVAFPGLAKLRLLESKQNSRVHTLLGAGPAVCQARGLPQPRGQSPCQLLAEPAAVQR